MQDNNLNNTNFNTEAHVPTARYGQYLAHENDRITPAVAAMGSCFVLMKDSTAWPRREVSLAIINMVVLMNTVDLRPMSKVQAIPQSWYEYFSAETGIVLIIQIPLLHSVIPALPHDETD